MSFLDTVVVCSLLAVLLFSVALRKWVGRDDRKVGADRLRRYCRAEVDERRRRTSA